VLWRTGLAWGLGTPSSGQTVIARFQASNSTDLTVNKNTQTIIEVIDQPFGNHNAGDLVFGPDKFLYIPLGDGGSGGDPGNRSQNPQERLGKLLRIDVSNTTTDFDYDIPADNPFVGNPAVLDEIFATGLRNPFRISFDDAGNLWIADVGQTNREEVNMLPAGTSGQNFGWKCREGFEPFSPNSCAAGVVFTEPVFDYGRDFSNGGISITGGGVYKGSAVDLKGYYVCADFGSSNFFLLPPGGGQSDVIVQGQSTVNNISTFGEDDNGELYVGDLSQDRIYRITTQRALPANLAAWTATTSGKQVNLNWTTTSESGTQDFIIGRSAEGSRFSPLATISAAGDSNTEENYSFVDTDPLPGQSFYRLLQRDLDGTETNFGIRSVRLGGEEALGPVVSPNPARSDFSVRIPELQYNGEVSVRLFSTDGRKVFHRTHQDIAGPLRHDYSIADLPAGVYQVLITYDEETFVRKLVVE